LSRPTRFSIDKAERELGWRPEIPVREGLEDVLTWLKATDSILANARKTVAP
jgi:nucleoside-diphosphate-sugar epimerase